jgi:phosphoribosylformimino-5-aminoimidazole carboxamide ribotide isomerase
MEVIPVIDLQGGQVVHARRGDRAAYRPIRTPLAPDSTPECVVTGLMALAPFRRLYVADLDAIAGGTPHHATWAALARAWPGVELWIDAGFRSAAPRSGGALFRAVMGSESQPDGAGPYGMDPGAILSLDFRGDAFLGPKSLLARAEAWPDDVIVMTLARVGAESGPDLALVAEIVRRGGRRRIYAAGGVRDARDLRALQEIGAAGALVATALHAEVITAAELRAFRD